MNNIKLIACDIDGVLLKDTFSPVLRILANKYGVEYTSELENNTFSKNREEAADYLLNYLMLPEETSIKDFLSEYFEERKYFVNRDGNPIIPGVLDFLELMKSLEVKLVCYGGLEEDLIDLRFKPYLKYFDKYICTNSFRPGLKEITELYGLRFSEVLFIDDVSQVAEEAKRYFIPFIGIPANHSWGFQKKEMKKIGVKYLVSSVKEITKEYLEKVDSDNVIWERDSAMEKSRYEIGINNLEKIVGESGNATRNLLSGDFDDVEKYIIEFVFGDIYNRSGMDLKQRELITLSTLIAQGAAEAQIMVHLRSAINLGISKEELIELFIQCIPNVGFPKVLNAISIAKKIIG